MFGAKFPSPFLTILIHTFLDISIFLNRINEKYIWSLSLPHTYVRCVQNLNRKVKLVVDYGHAWPYPPSHTILGSSVL